LSRLKGKSGADVLAELTQEFLIEQEAHRQTVSLSGAEENDLERKCSVFPNPDAKAYALAQGRSQLLLRKLILQDVSEADLLRVFDLYREELERFDVSVILLATTADAKAVWARLDEKLLSFEQLAATYSIATIPGGSLGFMTRGELASKFGEVVTEKLVNSPPGAVLAPMYCNQGLMILRVGGRKQRFEELRASVEEVFVNAKLAGFRHELVSRASVTSPYLSPIKPQSPVELTDAPSPSGLSSPPGRAIKLPATPLPPGIVAPQVVDGETPSSSLLKPR